MTVTHKLIIQFLGFDSIMRSSGGVLFSRLLFIVVNMLLVASWAQQLAIVEEKALIQRKIMWYDREIARLERLKDEFSEIARLEGRKEGIMAGLVRLVLSPSFLLF